MNNLIKIGNQEISEKEFNGQRVVSFKDIDLVHERPEGTARKRFNDNKKHFIACEDYFVRNTDEAKNEFGITAPNGLMLLTEQGYLMLVKSFTDDLAWTVQRQLVSSYFNKRKPLTATEQIKLQLQAIGEIDERVSSIDKDLQEFKQDMPILGIEESRITGAVRRKGVRCLGGKDSEAYKDRSLRSKVYSDIYGELKRQFGVASYKAIKRSQCDKAVNIVEIYELPLILAERISDTNSQIGIWKAS